MNNDNTCLRCHAAFSRYDTCDTCNGTLCGSCCSSDETAPTDPHP